MSDPHVPRPPRPTTFSRRTFLTVASAGVASTVVGSRAAHAVPSVSAAADGVRYLSDFAQDRYFAYPHQNPFYRNGTRTVLGQRENGTASLWEYDLATGNDRLLARFQHTPVASRQAVYFEVSANSRLLVTPAENVLNVLDLDQTASPVTVERIWAPPSGTLLAGIVAIHPSELRALAYYYPQPGGGPTTAVEVDLATGRATEIFSSQNHHSHFQYCAHDPDWIGFSREDGPRVWAMHPQFAPGGRNIWDQRSPSGGRLNVGHEVWTYYDTSAVVVAYPSSPAGPRGLYEVYPDGSSRLIQQADNYWHCNVSRDGRRAVVDTQADSSGTRRIELIDVEGNEPPLLLARPVVRGAHPGHPHPQFTPDATAVIYTGTERTTGRLRVVMVDVPPGYASPR